MNQVKRAPLDVIGLFPQIKDIKDAPLRDAVVAVWQDLWSQSEWENIADNPVSGEIPYPNLPHAQCVVTMAIAVADAFEKHHNIKMNRDYLIAAAVLQDASKVVEYAPGTDGKVKKTSIGKNFPHGFWCARLAVDHGIPDEVSHVMLTHSSSASQFPDTLEGKILYYVDQIDVIGVFKDRWKKHLHIGK